MSAATGGTEARGSPAPPTTAERADGACLGVYLQAVGAMAEPAMRDALLGEVDAAHVEAVAYSLGTGGKRLRRAVTSLACEAAGGRAGDALPAAVANEVLHHYTLSVDDVIDDSAFRRGRPTLWKKVGRSVSDCVAAHRAAGVLAAVARARDPAQTMAIVARALKAVADGEIEDALMEQRGREEEPYVLAHRSPSVGLDDWTRMAAGKAGALFAAAETGAVAAGASAAGRDALRRCGESLGLAFRAQDDLLDVFGDEERFGKRVGKDVLDRKRGNLVLLPALEKDVRAGRDAVERLLEEPPSTSRALEAAISLVSATGARVPVEAIARRHARAAREALGVVPASPPTATLQDVTAGTETLAISPRQTMGLAARRDAPNLVERYAAPYLRSNTSIRSTQEEIGESDDPVKVGMVPRSCRTFGRLRGRRRLYGRWWPTCTIAYARPDGWRAPRRSREPDRERYADVPQRPGDGPHGRAGPVGRARDRGGA